MHRVSFSINVEMALIAIVRVDKELVRIMEALPPGYNKCTTDSNKHKY